MSIIKIKFKNGSQIYLEIRNLYTSIETRRLDKDPTVLSYIVNPEDV